MLRAIGTRSVLRATLLLAACVASLSIMASGASFAAEDAYEPDDTVPNAKAIAFGETQTRSIHAPGDVDWVKFTTTAPGGVRIRIELPTTSRAYVRLYTTPGSSSGDDEYAYSSSQGFAVVERQLVNPGTYYFRVYESNNDDAIEQYKLTLASIPGDAYETDDTVPNAKAITFGETQTRSIHAPGDVDWVKFTTTEPGGVRIRIELPTTSRAYVRLYTTPGSSSGDDEYAYSSSQGFAVVERQLVNPGTYYFRVYESNNDDAIEQYKLTLASIPGDAYETDDSPDAAQWIVHNESQTRSIHAPADTDWVKFQMWQAGGAHILMQLPTTSRAYVRLYTTPGSSSGSSVSNYSSSHGFAVIDHQLAAGTYYIKIYESNNAAAIPMYTLSLDAPGATPPQVEVPTFRPAPGNYVGSVQVTMSCGTPDASIRYTTDGSDPTSQSTLYASPLTLHGAAVVLKARAFRGGMADSSVTSGTYVMAVDTPVFSPDPGESYGSADVTITCGTEGASIRWTADGTDPTVSSTLYGGPITLTETTTLKARAFHSDLADSDVATGTYTILPPRVAQPSFSPAPGTYDSPLQVTIACEAEGATIRYTTNGVDPTADSPQYTSPVTLTLNITLKAYAYKSGMSASEVASGNYAVRAAPPTFSPEPGEYIASVAVALSCTTEGASIRYTTDGSDPSSSSILYDKPITLTDSGTVKARAFKDGMTDSTVSEAAYTITPNHAPGVPELLGPADGSVVWATQSLSMKAADPEGDQVKFVIEATLGSSVRTYKTGLVDSGSAATLPVPGEHPLTAGRWLWRAKAVDARGAEGGWSPTSALVIPSAPPQVASARGLSTFGIPAGSAGTTPESLGILPGGHIAVWDPAGQRYLVDSAVTTIEPGVGCWVKADAPIALHFVGQERTEAFPVHLRAGWNLISAPFASPVTWDVQAIKVQRAGQQDKTLAAAQNAGWIRDYAIAWESDTVDPNTGSYSLVYDRAVVPGVTNTLDPWRAYWVRAFADCTLVLPPPTARMARIHRDAVLTHGWSIRMYARGHSGWGQVMLGSADGPGLAVGMPPDPPGASAGALRAALVTPDGPQAVCVQPSADRRQEWELVVDGPTPSAQSASAGEEITLSWSDLRAVPKDITLTLVDTATGAKRSLRTTAGYTFRARSEPRRFRIVAERRARAALVITGLRVLPLRSNTREVEYILSTTASVDLHVISPAGRIVSTITHGRSSAAGINRSVCSTPLGPGLYVIRATATTDEGTRSQVTAPFVVTR